MATDPYDDYANILGQSTPEADSGANTLSQIDIGGNLLFGYGDASKNRKIAQRQASLDALKGRITAEKYNRLKASIAANSADWDALTDSILGADGKKLHDFYQGVEASDQSNLDAYKNAMGDYSKVEDLFSNPNFYGDVGDVSNAAKPTDATVQEQRGMLAKMKSLSDPTETAAERFQRLMAQKTADANMKGQRDSIAENLKARGVYGSGAEVVQNMMSQADEANRRYMANLAAVAQAQQRATQMLGMGSDLATKMRGAETQEGALANQVNMFNNQVNQNLMNTRSGAQIQGHEFDTGEQGRRATSRLQAETGLNTNLRGDNAAERGTTMDLTKGKIGLRNAGDSVFNELDADALDEIKNKQGVLESSKGTGGWLTSGGMG
jgi:hypothetical protein